MLLLMFLSCGMHHYMHVVTRGNISSRFYLKKQTQEMFSRYLYQLVSPEQILYDQCHKKLNIFVL